MYVQNRQFSFKRGVSEGTDLVFFERINQNLFWEKEEEMMEKLLLTIVCTRAEVNVWQKVSIKR